MAVRKFTSLPNWSPLTKPTLGSRQTQADSSPIQAGDTPCTLSVTQPSNVSASSQPSRFSAADSGAAAAACSARLGVSRNIQAMQQVSSTPFRMPSTGACSRR